MKHTALLGSIALTALLATTSAQAGPLITKEEAKLPAAAKVTMRGGLTRGPKVKIISPAEQVLKSPFDMKVKFESFGGAKIDPASVKVTYLKTPLVDLTDRVKPFMSADGIDFAKAEVPPGEHEIRVQVTDTDGRVGNTVLSVKVEK